MENRFEQFNKYKKTAWEALRDKASGLSVKQLKREAKKLIASATLASIFSLVTSTLPEVLAAEAPRPNIIFILADDLGYGDVGFNGQTMIQTPEIDQMRAEGMNFNQAYCGSAVCAPSRAALMTGFHSGHCSVSWFTPDANSGSRWRIEDATVAELLQGAGYDTHFIGKWGFGAYGTNERDGSFPEEDLPNPAEFYAIPSQMGFDTSLSYLHHLTAHYHLPQYLWNGGTREVQPGNWHEPYGTYTYTPRVAEVGSRTDFSQDVFMDRILNVIDSADGTAPFYFQCSFILPHRETIDPGPAGAQYNPYSATGWPENEQSYAAMISYLDRDVGTILDRVQANPAIANNTIVIFTSDNGAQFTDGRISNFSGDNSFFDSNGPLRGNKFSFFEGGIRVPFVVWWPGTVAANSTSDQVIAFWDFMPTACELAGVTPPSDIDGISYAPTLIGEGTQENHDVLYFRDYIDGPAGPGVTFGIDHVVTDGKWKLIKKDAVNGGGYELYDLENDIGETTNVYSSNPSIAADFANMIASLDSGPIHVEPARMELVGDLVRQTTPVNTPQPAVSATTVAYWRMGDEDSVVAGERSQTIEEATNNHDGTAEGASWEWTSSQFFGEPPVYHTDVREAVVPLSGELNTLSMDFISTLSQYISVPDSPGLDLEGGSFTLEGWVKLGEPNPAVNFGQRQFVFYKKSLNQSDAEIQWSFLAHGGDLPALLTPVYGKTTDHTGKELTLIFGNGIDIWGAVSNFEIVDDQWHYISVAVNPTLGQVRFVLDDHLETINYTAQSYTSFKDGPLILGAHHNILGEYNLHFTGKLDELRISNEYLDEADLLRPTSIPVEPIRYTIDFGHVEAGTGGLIVKSFQVKNAATGYSNLLRGELFGAGLTDPRLIFTPGSFMGLADGGATDNYTLSFDTSVLGTLTGQTIEVHGCLQRHLSFAQDGNTIIEVTGSVSDTLAPVMTLLGDESVTLDIGEVYVEAGVLANDAYEGDLTGSIITDDGGLDVNARGIYTITYTVVDGSGNIAQRQRTVTVGDFIAPVISLLGEGAIDHEAKTNYSDAGATASDDLDGDITGQIVVTNSVNIDALGNYTVTYEVSDLAGNAAAPVQRQVTVIDTTPPVITLVGDDPIVITVGDSFSDPGAMAFDTYDGDLSDDIIAASDVNATIVNDYLITYMVADSSGNNAIGVTRNVQVREPNSSRRWFIFE